MARRALLLLAALVLVGGCRTTSSVWSWIGSKEPRVQSATLIVPLGDEDGVPVVAALNADLYLPAQGGARTGIVLVPGGGGVSRKGTRAGDGTRTYEAPVAVTAAWGNAAAAAGFVALAYDKRTCSPKSDALCAVQPAGDLDVEGPVALAKDVDAACELLDARADTRDLVLFAHGQGAQIALASRCAERARAVVLIAPIPRSVDKVMVDALRYRESLLRKQAKRAKADERNALEQQALELKNQAATLEATFKSMAAGRFAEGARVRGATLAFWRGWLQLTARTESLAAEAKSPLLVVLGEWDLQYAPDDKERIRTLTSERRLLELPKTDHHLLSHDQLAPETTGAVLDALKALLAPKDS